MQVIRIKQEHKNAKIPTYGSMGAGAFDLFAVSYGMLYDNVAVYDLGFSVELPEDWSLFILSRSGQGFKHQTRLSNCIGLIDADYRGNVKVQLYQDPAQDNWIGTGKRIAYDWGDLSKAVAQGVLLHTPKAGFEIVQELTPTDRGTGGFGSTDKGT